MSAPRRRDWSRDDLRYLRESARRRVRAPTMARRLERTESAVRMKASEIGLSLDTREART